MRPGIRNEVVDGGRDAAGAFHGQQDVGQAWEPDRQESLQLAAGDEVGPVHLRRGDELPPVGWKALACEDVLEARAQLHSGWAHGADAERPRTPLLGG